MKFATRARLALASAAAGLLASFALVQPAPALAGKTSNPATGVQASWAWQSLGGSIGLAGMETLVVDGATEVFVSSHDSWHVLRGQPGDLSKGLLQVFVSEPMHGLMSLVLANGPSGQKLVVAALGDGTLVIYDAVTKAKLSTQPGRCYNPKLEEAGLRVLKAADLNGDGVDEYISLCNDGKLVAEGPAYAGWSLKSVGGYELAVGQMDGDAAMEIVSSSGKVIDADTHQVQWNYSKGFGDVLAIDSDGDGRAELISVTSDRLSVYDVAKKAGQWWLALTDVEAVGQGDLDGDGVPEVLVGSAQGTAVRAFSLVARKSIGLIQAPESGTMAITVADVNGDGVKDLLWSSGGNSSSGPYRLHLGDWQSQSIRWQTVDLHGPFIGPVVGDLDGDGVPEIVMASTSSDSYGGGRLVVFDSDKLKVRAISDPLGVSFQISDIKLRDLDGTGRLKIVVAGGDGIQGQLRAYNFKANSSFKLVMSNVDAGAPSGTFRALEVADVDGDGAVEVLVAGNGGTVVAYDPATGQRRWSIQTETSATLDQLFVSDVDEDGTQELGVLSSGARTLYFYDGKTHALNGLVGWSTLSSAALSGTTHLVTGGSDGKVTELAYFQAQFPQVQQFTVPGGAVSGLVVAPGGSWWVASGGQLRQYVDQTLKFETVNYGIGQARQSVVSVPGRKMVFTTGPYGILGFKTNLN
ncbi:VCBS repeat-containing protein [Ideonella azotifigens]|uniref:VCBS repeat-containing protein n=1 Tax=Ideonella azotifigens TaxID=513160 RepID=A0ABN1K7N2_9BURK|nr:VCBS repeat-containing protein [Ideonella azotifigens]MCD2342330.1 VCBS repeat-containing protein [Ideonella azotifigens]